ncbi:hypothetical protein [Nitrosomonas sp.]|uniref:hypothetical protein n=1 Tax=Nitrosomonas sp. TaxID=42353 RepID=UPI0025F22395|nr:hypothetical protein [Nitrosomonas sp.]
MHMLDDAGVGGVEKLKLVRELGVIRKKLPEVAGVNKLTLVKRVREIRQLLSVSGGAPAVSLSIDPSNPIESLKSLTDYVKNGLSAVPEVLRGVEADIVANIGRSLQVERNDEHEAVRRDFWDALSDAARGNGDKTQDEWMIASFDHFKSLGNVFDIDMDVINATEESIKELTAKPLEEISPEIAAQMKVAQEEYEKLRLSLTSLISVNEANGFSLDEINKATEDYTEISMKKQSVWHKLLELDKQSSDEKKMRVKELKDSIAPIGQKIIDTLLNSSKVTQEQADSWANSQIIEKSAIVKLKKMGYPEADIRRDMSEFYRITGGKLRLVRIETNGSRRANAGGIGHFEDSVIRPGSAFGKTVLWHEMAHHLEADPVAVSASNGYLLRRRKNEKVHSLRSLTQNPGYRSNEGAYDDNFIDPYIGKVYQNRITEVWSMGVQYLATPQDAAMMAAKDPEMAALMAGYLQADLTPAMKTLQAIQDSAKDKAQEKREQVKSEYEQALDKLAAGVEIIDDGWFGALDPVDQENLLSRWGGLGDPEAKFIGSWGGYRVFTGKFRDKLSKRTKKGNSVAYTTMTGSFVNPDDNKSRFMPNSAPVHGDERFLKAFMRMASMHNDSVYAVLYNIIGRESKIVEEANKLSGEQS